MADGYGQHYESMYTGSMVGAGALVFALMGYVIAKAKPRTHTVDLNPVLLSTIFGEPVKAVEIAIGRLCQPDAKSRTKAEEGRRLIKRGEFEYFVVNHEYYRGLASKERRKNYMADLMAEKRSLLTVANTCKQTANSPASASEYDSVPVGNRGVGKGEAKPVHRDAEQDGFDYKFANDLMAFYQRKPGSRLSYGEESTLTEIIREHPRYRDEWDILVAFKHKEPRYFPQSLSKLLAAWQDTLDRANSWTPDPKTPKTLLEKEADAIERRIRNL